MTNRNTTRFSLYAVVLSIAAALLIAGSCGGGVKTLVLYEGERRTTAEVALITRASRATVISGVDSLVKKKPFSIKEAYIEVLPGPHRVEVNYYRVTGIWKKVSQTSVVLDFKAEAGHTYGVKSEGGINRWEAWIIDMADSSMVTEKLKGDLL